jgi:hypothetical protein
MAGPGWTFERTRTYFDDRLRQAIFIGQITHECRTPLDGPTQAAIDRVAAEFPDVTFESVLAAHEEFERSPHPIVSEEDLKRHLARRGYTVCEPQASAYEPFLLPVCEPLPSCQPCRSCFERP